MDNTFLNTISVEKFAAFLDGNLLPNEMQQISSFVESNEMMHDIYAASNLADETLAHYTDDDLTLPEEIMSSEFELPSIPINDLLPLEPSEELEVAACAACADDFDFEDEISSHDVDLIDDVASVEDSANQLQDEISFSTPDDDGEILSDSNDL